MGDTPRFRVIGPFPSPYVRKLLIALNLKGLGWEIDPITPFYGSDGFTLLSPLRRVPVLIDGPLAVPDSTAACEARARWIEEFADSRMGEAFVWGFFNQRVIGRAVWGEKPDEERVKRVMEVDVPEICTYLESVLRDSPAAGGGYLFGTADPLVADVSVAVFFRNLEWARGGHLVDPKLYPILVQFLARMRDHPAAKSLAPYEDICMKVPPTKQREVLKKAGCPVTETTVGVDRPRRGFFKL
ncbi:glutathione S-transferase [Hyaloraphidium curvatum]|nr:glutathione S-transferase [Hyaloraphidium curvatum]